MRSSFDSIKLVINLYAYSQLFNNFAENFTCPDH